MYFLIGLKPLTHNSLKNTYAVLAEINWKTGRVVRSIRFPAANFTTEHAYMRSNLQGISVHKKKVYVALWNHVAIIDYSKFEVIDSFSHPLMSDLHGIFVTDENIYVCSTGIDALLCFDRRNSSLKFIWRPDDSCLSIKKNIYKILDPIFFEASFFSRLTKRLGLRKPIISRFKKKFKVTDYRSIDKRNSGMHFHHLNEVYLSCEKIILLTKGWNDMESSAIIELEISPQNFSARFLASPGSFCGAHDLIENADGIFLTESGSGSVGVLRSDFNGTVFRYKVSKSDYFLRGLCDTKEGTFLIGFSPLKVDSNVKSRGPFIREMDGNFERIIAEFKFSNFYTAGVGGAIHCIKKSPVE